jgi:hypothetical protein
MSLLSTLAEQLAKECNLSEDRYIAVVRDGVEMYFVEDQGRARKAQRCMKIRLTTFELFSFERDRTARAGFVEQARRNWLALRRGEVMP